MSSAPTSALAHSISRMSGRDPDESERASTPLELLFDLTFVIAIGVAAGQFAELVVGGHIGAALGGFGFAMFAIVWAWINFSWFASAFDTDDWLYRLMVMVQMTGVVILAIGIPRMFASFEHGHHLDNGVMVAGYVVMRIALIAQWLRAAAQATEYRPTCMTYARLVFLAQVGWIALAVLPLSIPIALVVSAVFMIFELSVPAIAERKTPAMTPWHPHHIAERYGLFAIIALGEGVVGTVASSTGALGGSRGGHWTWEAILVLIAGVGLTFGMWWVYFAIPFGGILHERRSRAFGFGYLHIAIFAMIAATGAGLHIAGLFLEGEAHISEFTAVAALALPVLGFVLLLIALHWYLFAQIDRLHIALAAGSAAVVAVALVLAAAGVSMAICVLVVMFAPVVVVIGYEMVGHQHQDRMLGHL